MIHFLRSLFSPRKKYAQNSDYITVLTRIFDESYYLETNPDVVESGLDGLDHYLNYGFKERRLPRDASSVSADVISSSRNENHASAVVEFHKTTDSRFGMGQKDTLKGKTLILPYHTKGNFFFKEISQHIADAANEVGLDAILVDEKEFKLLSAKDDMHCFIVAPQEFFYLGRKERLHQHAKSLLPAVSYLLAEQPQTVFFLSQLEYIFDSAFIVDMNFHVATYLRSLGVECHYLPLGYVESLNPDETRMFGQSAENMYLPKTSCDQVGSEVNQRPIDAVFIGNGCERRQRFFGEYAEDLSVFNMSVFMPDWKVPHSQNGLATLDANDSLALCQRSKIFLNVHRDDFEYFEWHRICMRGFLSGALVLTEPVFRVPEFEAGVHYLECPLDEMPEKINWLLSSEEGQKVLSQVSQAGKQAYLKTSMASSISAYMSFVFSHGE